MDSEYAEYVVFWLGVSAFITLIRGVWFSMELIRYWFFPKVDNRDIVVVEGWSDVMTYIVPFELRRQFLREPPRQEPPRQSYHVSYRVLENWHIVVMSDQSYKIGLVLEVVDEDNDLIMSVDLLVRVDLFFRFPMERVKRLFIVYAEDDDDTVLLADEMCVVLGLESGSLSDVYEMPFLHKTHWIRILQRKWKRFYAQRMERLRRRGSLSAQRRFELTGSYGSANKSGRHSVLAVRFED
jgi:hypothetical protein